MKDQRARLLLGTEHACGYLPDRRARSAFIDPGYPIDAARYGLLLDQGFRRSGGYVYRPMCQQCAACRPARIVTAEFAMRRRHRRCLARNAGVRLQLAPRLTAEHFGLYSRYLLSRHPDGGMDPNDPEAFHEFLNCPWGRTEFWEFREHDQLRALAVVDRVPQGLSAVYTFFEPELPDRSFGTFAILEQIRVAHEAGLPYVYLGYWVPGSPTMHYKRGFYPLELLTPRGWRRCLDEC
jgi:arginyl-tRNA--protein-N-Asp/Glu arginylyltransferase